MLDNVLYSDKDNNEDNKNKGNINKKFNAIMEDIKNDTRTYDNNINLYIFLKKITKFKKTKCKRGYGFDKAFNVFKEIDDKHIILNTYKPWLADINVRKYNVR